VAYYTATICKDGSGCQVVVHWDDNDPNRFITTPTLVDHPITDGTELESVLEAQGWIMVSRDSNNIGRGWAIVKRKRDSATHYRPFFNPLDRGWYGSLSDEVKWQIRATFPEATVPGVPAA